MPDHDLAIDCRLRRSTGIGRYISELVPRVVAALLEWRTVLLGSGPVASWFWERILPLGGQVALIVSEVRVSHLRRSGLFCVLRKMASWLRARAFRWT